MTIRCHLFCKFFRIIVVVGLFSLLSQAIAPTNQKVHVLVWMNNLATRILFLLRFGASLCATLIMRRIHHAAYAKRFAPLPFFSNTSVRNKAQSDAKLFALLMNAASNHKLPSPLTWHQCSKLLCWLRISIAFVTNRLIMSQSVTVVVAGTAISVIAGLIVWEKLKSKSESRKRVTIGNRCCQCR